MPISLPDMAERTREFALKPGSVDENTRSVRAVIATDDPVVSGDARNGKGVLDVWRMDGCDPDESTPLVDAHNLSSVRGVLGSVTDREIQGGEMTARIQISEAEPNIWTKVREGHIRAVSGRCLPTEMEVVQRGQTRAIRGQSYTAPRDRDLNVVTRWKLREVSLVPIGADPRAKIRSVPEKEIDMNEKLRAYLEGIGLAAGADEATAKAFYDSLPEATRAIADAAAAKADPPAKPADKTRAATEPPTAPIDADKVRSEGVEAERKRVKEIERLGAGLPAETVRKLIDDGKSIEEAKDALLEAHRKRSAPVEPGTGSGRGGPAIHVKDGEISAEAVGFALAMRGVSGDDIYRTRGEYQPAGREKADNGTVGTAYRLRRAHDHDAHKKRMERLLDQADEYAGLSLHDMCRIACQIDGNPVSLRMSPEETFRTAVSGSALAQIFTTNINAQFLTGYTDYYDTTTGWVSEADVANFLTQERDTMGKFGSLKKVVKGRPADHLNTSDWKEEYKIARYGGQFVIDEIDIINDRFGALEQESPKDMGLAAAQLRPNLVYGIILENGNLDVDGGALFNSTAITTAGGHANYAAASSGAGGPLAADSLQAGILAMGKQRINGRVLNLRPRYLIVPMDLKFTAGVLLNSVERFSTGDNGTYNPLKELGISLVVDDRIGVGGVTDPRTDAARAGTAVNWYLACRPGEEGAKTIEVGYLRGSGRAPQIRSFMLDKGQWGMGWDIKFDIGGKALDFRGLYKAKGSS